MIFEDFASLASIDNSELYKIAKIYRHRD